MRERYQKGSLAKVDGIWIVQWWEDGHRRKRTLGKASKLPKSQAEAEMASIVAPIKARSSTLSATTKFGDFVNEVYLPFYRRKSKRSTAMTNEDRLRFHLTSTNTERTLCSGLLLVNAASRKLNLELTCHSEDLYADLFVLTIRH